MNSKKIYMFIIDIETYPAFEDATIVYYDDEQSIETRRRIYVNKEIDPFEEEIWYEDETKIN